MSVGNGYAQMTLALRLEALVAVADLLPAGTSILKNSIDLYHVATSTHPLHLSVTDAVALFARLATIEDAP